MTLYESSSEHINLQNLPHQRYLRTNMHSSEGDHSPHDKNIEEHCRNNAVRSHKGAWAEDGTYVGRDCYDAACDKHNLVFISLSVWENKASGLEEETSSLKVATTLSVVESVAAYLMKDEVMEENKNDGDKGCGKEDEDIEERQKMYKDNCDTDERKKTSKDDDGRKFEMEHEDNEESKKASKDDDGRKFEMEHEDTEESKKASKDDDGRKFEMEYEDTEESKKTSKDDDGRKFEMELEDTEESKKASKDDDGRKFEMEHEDTEESKKTSKDNDGIKCVMQLENTEDGKKTSEDDDGKRCVMEVDDTEEAKKTSANDGAAGNECTERDEDFKQNFMLGLFKAFGVSCKAINSCSVVNSSNVNIFLVLVLVPSILSMGGVHAFKGPMNQVVKIGDQTVLSCFTYVPNPIKWFKNGEPLYSGYAFVPDAKGWYAIANGSEGQYDLIIKYADEKMGGFYTCQQSGVVKSITARVIVLDVNCITVKTNVTTVVCTAVIFGNVDMTGILWQIIRGDSVTTATGSVTLINTDTVGGIQRRNITSSLILPGNVLHTNGLCRLSLVFNYTGRSAIGPAEEMADNIPTYTVDIPFNASEKMPVTNNAVVRKKKMYQSNYTYLYICLMAALVIAVGVLLIVVTILCDRWKQGPEQIPLSDVVSD